jgi:hypothetical protein
MLQNVIIGEKGTVASLELTILQMVAVPIAECVIQQLLYEIL